MASYKVTANIDYFSCELSHERLWLTEMYKGTQSLQV